MRIKRFFNFRIILKTQNFREFQKSVCVATLHSLLNILLKDISLLRY
jgi:hypothetical protein